MNKIELASMKNSYNIILKEWLELVDNIYVDNGSLNLDDSIKKINELYEFLAGQPNIKPQAQGNLFDFVNIFLKADLLYDNNYVCLKGKDIAISDLGDKDLYIFKIDELENYINTLETMKKSGNDNTLAKVKTELESSRTQNFVSYLTPIKPVFLVKELIRQKFTQGKDKDPKKMQDLLSEELNKYEHGLQNWIINTTMYNELIKSDGSANTTIQKLVNWVHSESVNTDSVNTDSVGANITCWIKIAKIIDDFYDVKLDGIYNKLGHFEKRFDDRAQLKINLFGENDTSVYKFGDDISVYYYECLKKWVPNESEVSFYKEYVKDATTLDDIWKKMQGITAPSQPPQDAKKKTKSS